MTRFLVLAMMLGGCLFERGSGGGPRDGGGGSGRSCGGFAGDACSASEFCDFGRNSCGTADEAGTCRSKPTACPEIFAPVCGCDGIIHDSECVANAAGVDVNANGGCPVPAGAFSCGFLACDSSTEYCQRSASDVGGEPDGFSCRPLPPGCALGGSCSCVSNEPCGDFCTTSPIGLTLTCPGG